MRPEKLTRGLLETAENAGLNITINREGSMFTIFFTFGPVIDYNSAIASDSPLFSRFFKGILKRGILLPPSPFETIFFSTAHDDESIDATITAAAGVFSECAQNP